MKNLKSLVLFAFATFAIGVFADYAVYWEVSGAEDMYTHSAIEFDYATISAVDASSPDNPVELYQYGSNGQKIDETKLFSNKSDSSSAGPAYSGAASLDDIDYFLVGLYSFSDERLGWQRYSRSDVLSYIWDTAETAPQNASPLTVSAVVPEPTSGLLVLLGMAALALRRKNGNA